MNASKEARRQVAPARLTGLHSPNNEAAHDASAGQWADGTRLYG